jgi:hypothetical protein
MQTNIDIGLYMAAVWLKVGHVHALNATLAGPSDSLHPLEMRQLLSRAYLITKVVVLCLDCPLQVRK